MRARGHGGASQKFQTSVVVFLVGERQSGEIGLSGAPTQIQKTASKGVGVERVASTGSGFGGSIPTPETLF